MSAVSPTPWGQLHRLLVELFPDPDALRAFVRTWVADGAAHVAAVNWEQGASFVAAELLERLEGEGALDARFFEALTQATPRTAEVEAVRAAWAQAPGGGRAEAERLSERSLGLLEEHQVELSRVRTGLAVAGAGGSTVSTASAFTLLVGEGNLVIAVGLVLLGLAVAVTVFYIRLHLGARARGLALAGERLRRATDLGPTAVDRTLRDIERALAPGLAGGV